MDNIKTSEDLHQHLINQQKELAELRQWKAEQMAVWKDVYEYAEGKLPLGSQLSVEVIRAFRERDLLFEIYESIKRARPVHR